MVDTLGWCDLCLDTKDVKASATYYEGMGFEKQEGNVDEGWIVMGHGNLRLGLYQRFVDNTTINFRGGDVEAIVQEMEEYGYAPTKYDVNEEKNIRGATFVDPDGYFVFFNTYPEEPAQVSDLAVQDPVYKQMPELPLGRTDICLDVTNLEESVKFYKDMGLTYLEGDMAEGWYIVGQGNLRLALFQKNEPKLTINFRGGDVKTISETLQAKGYSFEKAYEEESDGSKGATMFDPDGHFIYFNTHPSEKGILKTG